MEAASHPGETLTQSGSDSLPAHSAQLYSTAEAAACGLSPQEFAAGLHTLGVKLNYNRPPGQTADATQQSEFFHVLRLADFALAQGCALGREAAWQRFLTLYRTPLTQAAVAIAGNATVGHDLADSLYAELYGMRERDGERRSPLASYTGRGSLLGWLRATLAQRHVDHHRRTRREAPLEGVEAPAREDIPVPVALQPLTDSLQRTLLSLPADERFLLASYFLERRTLQEIARTLRVHEATISRRLKRLTEHLRGRLLDDLQRSGLSRRAAQEALGADPRDIEINLRALLQTSQAATFQESADP